MKQIAPFICMIAVLIVIAVVIISMFHYRLRKRLLESGPVDEHTIQFLNRLPGASGEALKWGLILFFGGLGLVVLEFIPYNAEKSSLPFGLEIMFLSAGFLLYYFIMKRK
ncbi:hypothetical protein CLV51_106178 [Chitinophaga niastensis]|uniref:DUF6249 domain-containing protein n=1 Tax=Chitinophaga niastensis TaxID=536980 RepID=A0A2P8HDN2_CHINA|nr:DUF6249 domain-containing protein [Chitinophaga niastensis]PSL44312.1 hypothetical protein CLV51_106178 [Chitinophaga niastensis]